MEYRSIPTTLGRAKLEQAALMGVPLQLSLVEFGDGGGAEYEPTGLETALRGKVYEAAPITIFQSDEAESWVEIQAVIPFDAGGWWLREYGVRDTVGDLIFIGNLPQSFKPQGSSGAVKDVALELLFDIQNADSVTLKVDPSKVLASRKWVIDNFLQVDANAQLGQVPYKAAAGLGWRFPYQTNAQFKASSTALAAKAGHAYHLTSNAAVTLPAAAGLAVGDALRFTKAQAVEQVLISVEGAAGETVTHNGVADTSFYLDINAEVIVVWNGAGWEV